MKPEPGDSNAIVLAAGKGERYDGIKQLATINEKPVLQHVLDSVREINWSFNPILVLGYKANRISSSINPEGFRVVENPDWEEGMSTSLKKGVSETPEHTSGFIFFLGDMPLVRSPIITKVLKKAADGASIVAPVFQGERGFPVYLPGKWRSQLISDVSGDQGARRIIRQNREDFTQVETDDRGVVTDLNQKSDLARIKSYLTEEGAEIGV